MTANVYTHLGLLDVSGAVEKLPRLGVAEQVANFVTPTVTLPRDKWAQNESLKGNIDTFKGNNGSHDTDRILTNKDGA
jgi:hypothetical protein